MKTNSNRDVMLTKTNIELLIPIYEQYKEFNKLKKFPLPKLLNRAMSLWIQDEEFRKKINNHNELLIWNKNF
jgi:hypothetical protein